ncbi:MAG: HlyD family efflux transporter periplasmic adaptor subunit [Anaerolineae bacterium]|nr:HlyD family efflux transporter periplasmic adaptor subunit [Anaerolineae bacterium]
MKIKAVWIILIAISLAGCGMLNQTPEALPTVVLDAASAPAGTQAPAPVVSGAEVTASGAVYPARQVQVAAAQGGNVAEVLVTQGQQVTAGTILVRLSGSERLSAAVEAARTELLVAQQDLQKLKDNAGQARAAALLRLANANKALNDATKERASSQYRVGSDASIDAARANVIVAKDTLDRAQEAYDAVASQGDDSLVKAGALSALSSAQKAYNRAVANLNYLLEKPNPLDVDLAEARFQAAQAEVDAAQRELEKWQSGPDPAALALAEQRVTFTQAQLAASQAALRDMEITAPYDATVVELTVDPGAWVTPGQPLLALADLAHLQVRTSDLSERDVSSVQVGQPALVTVKALGLELNGQVSEISLLAESLGGDVVYTTVIDLLDAAPPELRAGMSVDVRFQPGP